jgi:hypothetical protein
MSSTHRSTTKRLDPDCRDGPRREHRPVLEWHLRPLNRTARDRRQQAARFDLRAMAGWAYRRAMTDLTLHVHGPDGPEELAVIEYFEGVVVVDLARTSTAAPIYERGRGRIRGPRSAVQRPDLTPGLSVCADARRTVPCRARRLSSDEGEPNALRALSDSRGDNTRARCPVPLG